MLFPSLIPLLLLFKLNCISSFAAMLYQQLIGCACPGSQFLRQPTLTVPIRDQSFWKDYRLIVIEQWKRLAGSAERGANAIMLFAPFASCCVSGFGTGSCLGFPCFGPVNLIFQFLRSNLRTFYILSVPPYCCECRDSDWWEETGGGAFAPNRQKHLCTSVYIL